jgi:hypothetical protein
LRNTLKDLLQTICQKPHNFSMDFDPHNPKPSDEVASKNLEQVTNAFMISIGDSITNVPISIREICRHIAAVVGDKWPESAFVS